MKTGRTFGVGGFFWICSRDYYRRPPIVSVLTAEPPFVGKNGGLVKPSYGKFARRASIPWHRVPRFFEVSSSDIVAGLDFVAWNLVFPIDVEGCGESQS